MALQKWKITSSKYLIQDRWISLRADRCETASGLVVDPYYVMEEADWAHVVAFDDRDRILILRQYRHGSRTICAELPAGAIDESDSSPLAAVQRELMEETGCIAEKYEPLGSAYANPGRQNNRVYSFIGYKVKQIAEPDLDETEEIDFEFMNLQSLFQLIDSGEFSQSIHISSLFLALRKRGIMHV